MATPSIAMIPSAYKTSKVYSVLPTNGGGDLTFSRASSATRINKDGLIEVMSSNIPRLDYTNGGCPSLLLEPQSTNLINYSEDFSNAYHIKANSTITPNASLSPKNDLTADKLIETASASSHLINDVSKTPSTSGLSYIVSIFVKKAERRFIRLQTSSGFLAGSNYVNFNTDLGTVESSNGAVVGEVERLNNGWFRCAISFTSTVTGSGGAQLYVMDSDNTSADPSYLGDGTSGLYIWGMQIEQQSSTTSYIPTTSAAVTRLADAASVTTTGLGLTSITETFKDGSTNTITTIPTTYTVSAGEIAKIIGE